MDSYLRENWINKSLIEIKKELGVDLYTLLMSAYNLRLHKRVTPNIARKWTEEEDQFLKDMSNKISILEASNLLYRSRFATYQRVRYLNIPNMIQGKK